MLNNDTAFQEKFEVVLGEEKRCYQVGNKLLPFAHRSYYIFS